jgi:hypothetical protein
VKKLGAGSREHRAGAGSREHRAPSKEHRAHSAGEKVMQVGYRSCKSCRSCKSMKVGRQQATSNKQPVTS